MVSSAHTAAEELKSMLAQLALEPQLASLREQVDALKEENSKLAVKAAEAEFNESLLEAVLPEGVTPLRDGTYETDEKIRLFKREISKRPLVELEAMFKI